MTEIPREVQESLQNKTREQSRGQVWEQIGDHGRNYVWGQELDRSWEKTFGHTKEHLYAWLKTKENSMYNVPDDYDQYWDTCHKCHGRYHLSQNDCKCEQCEECTEWFNPSDVQMLSNTDRADTCLCHSCYEDIKKKFGIQDGV